MKKRRDLLERVFGPDPNPHEALPTLPYNGCGCGGDHTWVTVTRHDVTGHECQYCGAVRGEC